MKKSVITILLLIISYLVFFVQISFFNNITLWGVKPNIILIYAIFLVSYTSKPAYILILLFMGLLVDLSVSNVFGLTTVSLIITALVMEKFNNIIYSSSVFIDMLKIFVGTIIYSLMYYILFIGLKGISMDVLSFLKIVGIESIYNLLLVIIIYPLTAKVGTMLKGIYKKNNMLTRYF